MAVAERRLKHWGWGYQDQQPDRAALEEIGKTVHERLGFEVDGSTSPSRFDRVEVPESRLTPPRSLADLFSADPYDRVSHSLGKAYRDVVRGFRGEFEHPPDLVAFPRSAEDVDAVLAWAPTRAQRRSPYGGGTSVVGGVEPRRSGTLHRRRHASTCAAWTGCSRWTRSRGRRASRPGLRARASRISSASTA